MSADRESFVRTRLQSLRIIAGSLIGALVIFAVVAVVVLGLEEYPSPVTAAALFAINVAAFIVVEVVGYRTPAVPRDADEDTAVRVGLDALQQTTIPASPSSRRPRSCRSPGPSRPGRRGPTSSEASGRCCPRLGTCGPPAGSRPASSAASTPKGVARGCPRSWAAAPPPPASSSTDRPTCGLARSSEE